MGIKRFFTKTKDPAATKDPAVKKVPAYTFKNRVQRSQKVSSDQIEDFENTLPIYEENKTPFYFLEKNGEDRYTGFTRQELPFGYRYFTPFWLFSGMDWSPQARSVPQEKREDTSQKISLWLAIGIIVFAVIITFLIILVVAGEGA